MAQSRSNSTDIMNELLRKAKKVRKGAPLADAEIDEAWLTTYVAIARRCCVDRDSGVSRYPYELGSGVNPFAGGYFEHREWQGNGAAHKSPPTLRV
jgi:hypothetical protein